MAWGAYFGIERSDHQMANVVWTISTIIAALLGGLWLILRTSIPVYLRLAIVAAPLAGAGIFLSAYEFKGFSGELIPQFRPRGARPAPRIVAASKIEALGEAAEERSSFRQFLGNERNGTVSDVEIAEDWEKFPPTLLWKQPIGPGWSGFAIQDGLAVTLEEYDERDCLVAIDWNDGSLRWRTPLIRKHFHPMGGGGPRTTPSIQGKLVFAQSSTGIVCCCELATGKMLWKVDLLEKAGINQAEAELAVHWGRSGSPLLVDDLVVVPFGGAKGKSPASLIALDRSTGEERWRGGDSQISYASPSMMTIQGVEQIVIVNEASVSGHEPATGAVLWSYDWPGESDGRASVSQAVSIDPSNVLLSKGYGGGGLMLDFSKSTRRMFVVTPKWKNASLLKTKFTSAVYHQGYLYALSDGILECVRAEDGKRMWKDGRNGRFGHGQLLVVGRHLLISTEDGRCVLGSVDPDAFQKIGDVPVLSGITWNNLAIAGNRVAMRNAEQAACLEIPIRTSR